MIVVCHLTQSFTVAVGVEVAGVQPVVVVLVGEQLHAYHGSSLFPFLCLWLSYVLSRACCCWCYVVCVRSLLYPV